MNDRFFKDTATFFRFDDKVRRNVYNNICFKKAFSIESNEAGDSNNSKAIIIIRTDRDLDVKIGDYIVEGFTNIEDYSELINKCAVYRINSIQDNRKGGLPHLKIEASA